MSIATLPAPQLDTTNAERKHVTSTDSETQLALDVVARCDELIRCHPHFQGWAHGVSFRAKADRLVIRGQLASFFLKQLAQEAVREIEFFKIDNQIVVRD